MTTPRADAQVWGIVPAAGSGRRMGKPKQALAYGDSTLAGTVVRTLLASGVAGVIVVTRASVADSLGLAGEPRVTLVVNDAVNEMIDSIRTGLAFLARTILPPEATASAKCEAEAPALPTPSSPQYASGAAAPCGVMVIPADMPFVSVDTCRRCMSAFVDDPSRIVIAVHAGVRGHPIVVPFAMYDAIAGLHGGLNELPQRYPQCVHIVETRDAGVTRDVDTADEYRRLRNEPPVT